MNMRKQMKKSRDVLNSSYEYEETDEKIPSEV